MEQRASQYGLTFRIAGLRSGNTRDAHRLLHLAKAKGTQAELVEALHCAYFTDQASVFELPRSPMAANQLMPPRPSRYWPAMSTGRMSKPMRRSPGRSA